MLESPAPRRRHSNSTKQSCCLTISPSLSPDNAVTRVDFQIGVANRDYHQLSQNEIAGAKRIYQHLSGSAKIHWGGMQMPVEFMKVVILEGSTVAIVTSYDIKITVCGGQRVRPSRLRLAKVSIEEIF
jgi:hypothetical protein